MGTFLPKANIHKTQNLQVGSLKRENHKQKCLHEYFPQGICFYEYFSHLVYHFK